ncbi:hypothetical protein ACPWSR_13025 [Alloiococcus sp. CFN-8]|uniref:hypothetical protein n=1 Tax=Alloiococcus sp. CFN-8 TaxID=3416081 RepID=UPI003CF64D89
MNVIICLDDSNGMMFNKRRQSRDSKVIEDISKMIGEEILYISSYSEILFKSSPINYVITDNPLVTENCLSHCFIEDKIIDISNKDITQFTIYRWNRKYPGDLFFNSNLKENGFQLVSITEFVGTSHECIGKEVWQR